MNVFVAGATGAVGRPLVHQLLATGHEVTALSRSRERLHALGESDLRPAVADALDADALAGAVNSAAPEVVVDQLTSIPDEIDPRRLERDFAATNRLRTEGTRNLLDAARRAGARRVISQSIAFAYRPGPGILRQESDPLYLEAPRPAAALIRAVADHEGQVLAASDLEGVVLRYGFFYGPGTAYAHDGAMHATVRARKLPIAGKGSGTYSFVHVDDAAAATAAALEAPEGVYNVVDDEPATVAEWLPVYADVVGAPPPRRVPTLLVRLVGGPYAEYLMTEMPGASNEAARSTLGWAPRHVSWREGFPRALG